MMSLWKCSTCSKSFLRKGDLTRHKHLHTGYKPHVCLDCGKSFAQFSGLKTHRNVHTKARPFKCGINNCSAAFGDPSSCTRHRKETHGRLGAYQCPQRDCGSSIKRRSAFVAHLKKHGIDPSTVDMDAAVPPAFSSIMPQAVPMDTNSHVPAFGSLNVHHPNALPAYMAFSNSQPPILSYTSMPPFNIGTIQSSYQNHAYVPAAYNNTTPAHGSYPNFHEQPFASGSRSSSQSPLSTISSLSPSPPLSLHSGGYHSSSSSDCSQSQTSSAELSPLSEASSLLLSAEPSYAASYGQTQGWGFDGSRHNNTIMVEAQSGSS